MKNNLIDDQQKQICCQKCKFFEARNGFCRRKPPIPMALNISGVQVTTSNYPKISMPDVDWCGEFQRMEI